MTQYIAATMREILLRIRIERNYKQMTQADMAVQMDISQNAYSKLESGKTKLNLEHFLLICEILLIDPEELLGSLDLRYLEKSASRA